MFESVVMRESVCLWSATNAVECGGVVDQCEVVVGSGDGCERVRGNMVWT